MCRVSDLSDVREESCDLWSLSDFIKDSNKVKRAEIMQLSINQQL